VEAAIAAFLAEVAADPVVLRLSDEVVGDEGVAFMVTCELEGGRRALESTILTLRGDRIVRHVEVEAWDPPPT
jgi:hypothetical protein